jgi:GTPase SAR1 family protein
MRYAVFVTGKPDQIPLFKRSLQHLTDTSTPATSSGPAGAGKSTFCSALISHAQTMKRTIHYVNLDPAATNFDYEPAVDIKDLINLEDVMEELEFGPNGGLVYCFE